MMAGCAESARAKLLFETSSHGAVEREVGMETAGEATRWSQPKSSGDIFHLGTCLPKSSGGISHLGTRQPKSSGDTSHLSNRQPKSSGQEPE